MQPSHDNLFTLLHATPIQNERELQVKANSWATAEYHSHFNKFDANTPFSIAHLTDYFRNSKDQPLVAPRDAAHILSNSLTANFTPYHIIRPENIAMPNRTEATFAERSMEYSYQRNISTGIVQSLMMSRWYVVDELSKFKDYSTQKRMVDECQEGLMSLYLGYCKPLPAAERPQHLLFLSLDFVIPVLFRFRHELFAM